MQFMTTTKLHNEIALIGQSSNALTGMLSNIIPSVLYHAMKDGQATPALELVGALSRKHKATVVEYLCEFGPFSHTQKEGFKYARGKARVYEGQQGGEEREAFVQAYIEGLDSFADWAGESEKVKEYKDIDVEKVLMTMGRKLFKQIAEAREHGKSVREPSDPTIRKIFEELSML